MLPTPSAPLPEPEVLLAAEKQELVERVANSPTFQRCPRLREFFIYVAGCTLDGRPDEAREQQIAQRVFHRKPDYNPGQDNIVRVEARMLRKRLEAYFADEGKDSALVITMPKGSYALNFESRYCEQIGALAEPLLLPPPIDCAKPASALPTHHDRNWMTLSVIACLALTGIALYFFPRAWLAGNTTALRTFPSSVLANGQRETYVVTSDTSLVLIQDFTHQRVTLNDYINRRYPTGLSESEIGEFFASLQYRDYTDAVETSVASKIMLQGRRAGEQISLHSARQIQLCDLEERNIILLGSPESNPWGSLYYENLPFQFDSARLGSIRNQQPRGSEPVEYFAATRSGETGDAYAIVSLVPNIDTHGSVLLIAGTTAEATAAAGKFVLDQNQMSTAMHKMGIEYALGPPQYFELLLKAKTFPESATKSTIETWRRIQPADKSSTR